MRQRVRKTLLIISFLLFPVTIWYFSPYLIIQAASEHIMNGSFIVFSAMFILSMFLGRVWCGYLCPAGGLQECLAQCNPKPAKQGWRDKIKYVIWIVWITAVVVTFILGKYDVTINPFYMTDHGISVTSIYNYVMYYGVMLLLVLPALIHGRRATCHYICWMAPFMVIGSTIGRLLHIPQLHIEAEGDACVGCGQCNKACPMGLDVKAMAAGAKAAGTTAAEAKAAEGRPMASEGKAMAADAKAAGAKAAGAKAMAAGAKAAEGKAMASGAKAADTTAAGTKATIAKGKGWKCSECIQCGACIDACPKKVLKYRMKWRRG